MPGVKQVGVADDATSTTTVNAADAEVQVATEQKFTMHGLMLGRRYDFQSNTPTPMNGVVGTLVHDTPEGFVVLLDGATSEEDTSFIPLAGVFLVTPA